MARTSRRFRFADLTLRSKILFLVGLSSVMALVISGFAQSALSSARNTSHSIVANQAKPAITAGNAATAWTTYRRYVLRLLLSTSAADTRKSVNGLAAAKKTVDDSFTSFLAATLTPDQRRTALQAQSDYDAAVRTWEGGLAASAEAATTQQEQRAAYLKVTAEFVPPADKATAGLGQVVAESSRAMDASAKAGDASASRATLVVLAVVGFGVLGLVLAGFWIAARVATPVGQIRDALTALAEGDLTHDLDIDSRDEVGQMASALNRAQENLRESMQTITASSTTLAGSAEELSAVSARVASAAEETSSQSGVAAAAAEEVSRSVQTVAAATEEMTASISEIAESSTHAVQVASRAVQEAASATATVSKLGESSKEIGDVVRVITSIAEQTNLLALNATIEAARAGEAGKGFAVVATEVKDLAQETARATEDISQRVAAIQVDADAAVQAIAQISQIIEQVNDFQTTIASAVEEQTATTQEMSRNVSDAATGSSSIAENIESVASAAASSSSGISEAQRSASELAQLSNELRTLVSRFRI